MNSILDSVGYAPELVYSLLLRSSEAMLRSATYLLYLATIYFNYVI